MNEQFYQGNQQLEFRQIILSHMKEILGLSLKDSKDKLSLYISAIESLSDVLVPFFDEQMNKGIKEFEKEMAEISKRNQEKFWKLDYSSYLRSYKGVYLWQKRQAYRTLFRELNLLLKRNDYLASSVFGESRDEVVEDIEDNESEEGET